MPRHRHLPHLLPFASQPIVFITVVTAGRRPLQRSPALDGWSVGDFVLMPDHVHLFTRAAPEAKDLARWMECWKSLSARQLKLRLGITPPLWETDYFDRFLRSSDNYREKWDYVAMNPVRAGLCSRAEDWRWKGRRVDLWF